MPTSMTGFGKATNIFSNYELETELRSFNNRYLEMSIRIPKKIENYEQLIKDEIKKKVKRGKVSVTIAVNGNLNGADSYKLDEESLQYYLRILGEMKEKSGVKGEITLDHLLQFKDILQPNEEEIEDDELKNNLVLTLNQALDKLVAMRKIEAENISLDIFKRLKMIESTTETITKLGKDTPKEEFDKLYQRVQSLFENKKVDQYRLEMELALLSDRVDITEECTRLKSHIQQFNSIFKSKDEVGKPLTFILQEMHREVNTIGSKTSNVEISHFVISLKEEIEKLREQVQNLE